ncbi:hypothetical protein Z517_07842 [Fonsecaea pedrosoi CBS 271.37]|uniref:FAD/NAD(P)-binding domain-containing protein n=1 Tax=Fonsecaea pedrosoi CBS 271.37 TaxID=1442368 RepID=A0A0D2H067_9EURO|nr:uncharacterized protein Z517_07842 [Fonsecaea pedrosoi CBS 271.37]KIW78009.1 hypothetical protein Z517_07842 [Fonsecaea pedrosoi CBS 271.37]
MAIKADYDALVVGAGFGGIYQCYSLRKLGLTVKVIDAAGGVGGTWYWNRYPGAMSDTESYLYRFTWDKEDLQTYPWSHHYVKQPEVLRYLQHVVKRHDLEQYMQFHTELVAANWDESSSTWICDVKTADGFRSTIRVRYLVTALGLLSKQNFPDIRGLETFHGDLVHTGSWNPDLEVTGKRIAVIGSGSTGVQVITEIASKVKELVSFQRNPQYSVPSGDGPVTAEYRDRINANYDAIIEKNKASVCGFGLDEATKGFDEFTPDQQQQIFEGLWQRGNGFRFMFGGFADLTVNRRANEAACEFIKGKIRQTVKDPEKAKLLLPRQPYARRPLCDGGYYQQFNRDNVHVVDLQASPIQEITSTGIRTADGRDFAFDVIVFATGFEAVDGNYLRLNITGRDGLSLQDQWRNSGPRAYMGVSVAGFPNLFLVTGPQGAFSNIPVLIETHVEFITRVIAEAERRRVPQVEASQEAQDRWVAVCEHLAEGSIFREAQSWIFGSNVPGKVTSTRFFFGGLGNYRKALDEVIQGGFEGYPALQTAG